MPPTGPQLSEPRDSAGASAPEPSVAGQLQPTGTMRHVGTSRMFRKDVQTTHDDIALAFFSSNGKTAGVVPVCRRLFTATRTGPGHLCCSPRLELDRARGGEAT
jgi:hypothetical protein